MIPSLREIARHFGIGPSLVAIAAVVVLAGFVLLAQSVARWFDDRKS